MNEFKCVLADEAYISNIIVWENVLVTMGNTNRLKMWDSDLNLAHEYQFSFRIWCAAAISGEYVVKSGEETK